MAKKNVLVNLDLNQNQILNVLLQKIEQKLIILDFATYKMVGMNILMVAVVQRLFLNLSSCTNFLRAKTLPL